MKKIYLIITSFFFVFAVFGLDVSASKIVIESDIVDKATYSIGDLKNEIVLDNGDYYLIERVGKVVLGGTDNLSSNLITSSSSGIDNDTYRFIISVENIINYFENFNITETSIFLDGSVNWDMINNYNFPHVNIQDVDMEGMYYRGNYGIWIRVNKTRIEDYDGINPIEKFRNYVDENPLIIYYELENFVTTKINLEDAFTLDYVASPLGEIRSTVSFDGVDYNSYDGIDFLNNDNPYLDFASINYIPIGYGYNFLDIITFFTGSVNNVIQFESPSQGFVTVKNVSYHKLSYNGEIFVNRFYTAFGELILEFTLNDYEIWTNLVFNVPQEDNVDYLSQGRYLEGYNVGYNDGENDGYEKGYKDGELISYDVGYSDGYNKGQSDDFDGLSIMTDGVFGFLTALGNIQLLPGFKLAHIVGISLFFGVIYFIIGKRR